MRDDAKEIYKVPKAKETRQKEAGVIARVKNVLAEVGFIWQGRRRGEFASKEVMCSQLEGFLGGKEDKDGLSVEFIWNEIENAGKVMSNTFDVLGLSDDLKKKAKVYLPYHGKGHAWNTLVGGMKLFLPKLKEMARERGMTLDEQKYWIKAVTRTFALHEIDDWWIPSVVDDKEVVEKAKALIRDDLVQAGIEIGDFNDFIQLDDFVKNTDELMEEIKKSKTGLIPEEETKLGRRRIETNPEVVKAIGDCLGAADFMQGLNPNYQRKIRINYMGKVMEVAAGSLILALEMFLVNPKRIPAEWKILENGKWKLNYSKLNPDKVFKNKIIEKTAPVKGYLAKFNEEEANNAQKMLAQLLGKAETTQVF